MDLDKLFDELEEKAVIYEPVYAYDVKIANQIIRSHFESFNKMDDSDIEEIRLAYPCSHNYVPSIGNWMKCKDCGLIAPLRK